MGIYIFQTLSSWVKVGHHKMTKQRPNPYYRIAGKGFYDCVHPEILNEQLGVSHLTLVAWFPNLDMKTEKQIHSCFKGRVGEFHPQASLDAILEFCRTRGEPATVTDCQRKKALEWGWRRARKAKRKRKCRK